MIRLTLTGAKRVSATVTQPGTLAFTLENALRGPQGIQGIQGIQGEQGIQGIQGEQGPVGSAGSSIFAYKAKTSATAGDPGPGYILWNNASQIAATTLFIDHLTDDNVDIDLILIAMKTNDELLIADKDDSGNLQLWKITATPTFFDHANGSYISVPVSLTSSSGTGTTGFANNHSLSFVWRTGAGVIDHGALTGLADDDHTQYHNDARGDARYSQLGHGHAASAITNDSATVTGASVANALDSVKGSISGHIADTANPHAVTKAQVGLGSVDNTSDADKPISTATQTALNAKEPTITAGTTSQYWRGDKTWQTLPSGVTNLSVINNTATTLDVASDTGTDATIPAATASLAGLMSAADKTKLNAITGTNTGDQSLSLGTVTSTTVAISLSADGSATIPAATSSAAGTMIAVDKAKLDKVDALGANIASATTTDIGAATGETITVTGTTTITSLGTGAAGIKRSVIFAAALILTHNAVSLILPSAANITTAAGDTAEFVSLGSGNWKCLRFDRATGVNLVSDATKQAADAGLTSLAGLTGAGVVTATGTDAFAMVSSVPATQGGTGQTTYTVGDLLVGGATNTLTKLADVATGNVLKSGGVGAAPSWGKASFTTDFAALTASRALASDASGFVSVATTTLAELNFVSGLTSNAQTQINGKQASDAGLTSLAGLTGTGYVKETATDTFALVSTIPNTDITGLGTASTLNVPAAGNAAVGEVVKGSDTRLTDARTPTAHTHPLSDLTQSSATTGQVPQWSGTAWVAATLSGGSPANLSLGTATATTQPINNSNGTGVTLPEATISAAGLLNASDKTKLTNTSGTNTGDQTSIVGITGTKAQFNTAVTDGNFMYVGDAPTAHTHTSSEITDFASASRAQTEAELIAGSNITITPAGTGATRTLTIAAAGGGSSYNVGDTIDTASASLPSGTWLSHGIGWSDYLRATYPTLAALHPYGPACEQLEQMIIPRAAYQCIAKNVGGPWAASTTYVVGDYRRPTANANPSVTYRVSAITTGISGGSEPTWTTGIGGTISDGGVTWTVENIRYIAANTAVANGLAYSDDHCKTWRSIPAPAIITDIVFTGRYFIGVSASAYFNRSADGISWPRVVFTGLPILRSVASDGRGKVLFGAGSNQPRSSDDHGDTLTLRSSTIGVAGAYSVVYTGVSGSEFVHVGSAGQVDTFNSSTWAFTARTTATSMNQIAYSGSRLIASASAGTTTPLYSDDSGVTWTACAVAPAACRNFRYSIAYSRWYGFNNTNASTALYHSTDGVTAWSTATVAAYGIGQNGIDTGDGSFALVATNSTAANTASNLQRLATATTFDTSCGIPHAGATSFAFGEVSGKMFAVNTGASNIQQALVNDGTGWRTLRDASAAAFNNADRIFDLGNNVGLIARGSSQPHRTANANTTDPTWSNVGIFANYVIHNNTGPVTLVYDSGTGIRYSTDRLASGAATITNQSSLTDRGFTFAGHGVVFDGFYWFPGKDVQGYAAFAKVATASYADGANWTIESTSLDNAQFDFMATNGTIALALSASTGVVWSRAIGGSWVQVSQGAIAQSSVAWKDLLWCSGRGKFMALNNGTVSPPIWASVNGERWEGFGDISAALGRLGYSATLDQVFVSLSVASSTPIMSEIKTYNNATQFRLYQDTNKGASVTTYSKAT